MIFTGLMTIGGLIMAGDSFGRAYRESNGKILLLGFAELIAGIYFLMATVGLAVKACA